MTVLSRCGVFRRKFTAPIIAFTLFLFFVSSGATNSTVKKVARYGRSQWRTEQRTADSRMHIRGNQTRIDVRHHWRFGSPPATGSTGVPKKPKVIHIGAIFPMSGQWAGGIGCRPSAEMAVEEVNNRTDILTDYELVLDVRDSQCSPGLGTRMMYELLYNEPKKLMFLGPGCSLVSTFVAEAARSWNLLVLSWGSSSPALSDRTRFPTFFRTHPSAVLQNPVQIMLFKKWNWTRIAILQHIEEVFTTTVENLQVLAREEKIEISPRTSFAGADDVEQAIKQLKNQDARIIVGLFYENMARRVFCEAYKHGLYGGKYVWFIIGWFVDNWYELDLNQTSCTVEEMRTALEGHFSTESLMMNRNRSQVTWNGLSGQEFLDRLENRYQQLGRNDTTYRQKGSRLEGFVEAPLAYDAVWALALAINKSIIRLANKGLFIENFTYQNDEVFRTLLKSMQETKFLGVSTEVQFTREGDRNMLTQIEQFRNGSYRKVAFYDPNRPNETEWINEHEPVYWPDGKPPRDRTYVVERYRHVNKTLYWTFCAFAWLMIALCIVCLAFTIVFRDFSCVKSTQPIFNQLTLFGFCLALLTIMLNGLDQEYIGEQSYTTLCTVRASLLCYGFSFSYGAMFCKIWIVYRVSPRRKSAAIKDVVKKEQRGGYRRDIRLPGDIANEPVELRPIKPWEPKVLFLFLVICDSLVLMFLTIFDPLRRSIQKFPLEMPSSDETTDDIKYQPLLELCTSSTNLHAWLGLCFGYKGLLLIGGLLLAYDTRNVKVDSISDSRFVALCVYNVVILCIITASVSLIITDQQNPQFAFVSAVILLCTLLSVVLIFGPKALFILRFGVQGAAEVERKEENERLREQQEQQKYRELIAENEELQRRIQSTDERIRECKAKLNARIDQRLRLSVAATTTTSAAVTATQDQQRSDANRLSLNAVVHPDPSKTTELPSPDKHSELTQEKTLRFHLNYISENDRTSGSGANGTSGVYTSSDSKDANFSSPYSNCNHEDENGASDEAHSRGKSISMRDELRGFNVNSSNALLDKNSEEYRISNSNVIERSPKRLIVYTETCI